MKKFTLIIAVKCILVDKGKVLLIKESSQASWRPGRWGLPGGKTDPEENLIVTLNREMKEETGIKVKIKGLFRIEELIEQMKKENRLVHHFIFVVKKVGGKFKKPDQHVGELRWFSKKDLRSLSLDDYTEYYYKDLLTDYFKSKRNLFPDSIIKIRNTKSDKTFMRWLNP